MSSGQKPEEETRRVIAIDLGAQSSRISLVSWLSGHGEIREIYRFETPQVSRNAHIFWNLQRIRDEVRTGIRKCAEYTGGRIDSLGIDGWGVDYVRVDERAEPVADPFCYRDPRTETPSTEFRNILPPEKLYSITGIQMMRINTLYQLLADRQESLKPGAGWASLPEYLLHDLGGERVSEYTEASTTQLVHALKRNWSDEVFSLAGLDRQKAPPIVPPGTKIGSLHGPLAELRSLRNTQLVAPACHDTASAVAGIPDEGTDWAFISSGTWSLVGTLLQQPCTSLAAFQNNLSNEGGLDGSIRFLRNVNGMWLIEQCLRHWSELGKGWDVPTLVEACRAMPAPKELLDVDDAELHLPGEMPQRINRVLTRHSLAPYSEGPEDAPRLANLIFHSLAARYSEVLNIICRVTGKAIRKIYIVGGGSRNAYLNRLLAERTGLEVIRGQVESSTIGNAAIQMAVLGGAVGAFGVAAPRTAEWSRRLGTSTTD